MSFHRRRLPHWLPPGKSVFLTWRLKGSLPRNRFPRRGTLSSGEAFVCLDRYLDRAETGPRWLQQDTIAAMIVESIRHGETDLRHYQVGAYVVMPNHVHLLITPTVEVAKIMKRLKGYTARQANQILGREGEGFWQRESYDHWVRDGKEWDRFRAYIEANPVSAGLASSAEEYRWSSAALAGPSFAIATADEPAVHKTVDVADLAVHST